MKREEFGGGKAQEILKAHTLYPLLAAAEVWGRLP